MNHSLNLKNYKLGDVVRNIEDNPLTLTNVVEETPFATGVMYSSLVNVTNINKYFTRSIKNLIIMLDPPDRDIGHFVLLIKKSPIHFHFFDPYGNSIQKLLKILNLKPSLLRLLKNYKVTHNTHAYEVLAKRIATCGLHCVCRGRFHYMTNEQYRKMMTWKNLQPDELVVLMNLLRFDWI